MKREIFPFTAVVGQEAAKKALLITLVNPKAGGLLLSGKRGTAKSLLVRSTAEFTPTKKIVELPLGTTEDMVFGSVDMELALTTGERRLKPGILYRAADTILYMDEVNLLRHDFLLAVLDSAANGFFELQRDGICCEETVSYTPVGTMDPEEGTLTPSVLDRFGLFVSLEDNQNEEERTEILRRVLAFDQRNQNFREKYSEEENILKEKVNKARELLPEVEVPEAILELTAQYCARAYCRGNRAELYLLEAARSLAALNSRNYVMPQDVEEAAMFVLPHRMGTPPAQQPPEDENEETQQNDEQNDSQEDSSDTADETEEESSDIPDNSEEDAADTPENNDGQNDKEKDSQAEKNEDNQENNDMSGAMEQVFAALEDMMVPGLELDKSCEREKREGSGKRSLTRTDSRMGRYVRSEFLRANGNLDLAFDATLRAAAPYQRFRKGPQAVIIKSEDFRNRVREKHIGANIIFLVDASGSMASKQRMKMVKGVVLSLLKEAYQKRDRVGLIAFRREKAEVLLPVTRSVDLAEKLLRDLPTGGKTPLADGLESTLKLIYGLEKREKGQQTVVVLITDGRANATYEKDDPIARALSAAERFNHTNVLSIVLDTENDFHKLGIAPKIAQKMGASYYTLKKLSQEKVLRIVKAVQV